MSKDHTTPPRVVHALAADTPRVLAAINVARAAARATVWKAAGRHAPDHLWQVASDSDGNVRAGAWVAELTGLLDLPCWPHGMRVIARTERPPRPRSGGGLAQSGAGAWGSP